jgi:hypothetical protein
MTPRAKHGERILEELDAALQRGGLSASREPVPLAGAGSTQDSSKTALQIHRDLAPEIAHVLSASEQIDPRSL